MKTFLYLLLFLLPALSAEAQTVYKDQVRIENTSITRSRDNRLTIALDLILQANMKISSNRAATLTPVLQGKGANKVLPAVVVYGRRRALVNERGNTVPKDAYTILRRKHKTEQRVNYLIQLPYEKWMQDAELTLNADLCGCCNVVEGSQAEELIAKLNLVREKVRPSIAYITPKAEKPKRRLTVGRAFLDYPVNQTVIVPDYRKNPTELAKIRATIDTVRNDQNVLITDITIEGYASPEGGYANNARLAKGRTAALLNYVSRYYSLSKEQLKMNSTPEDWAGYRNFVLSSNLPQKEELVQMIDLPEKDMDAKEKRIARFMGPDTYRYILTECYPALRHSDYTVAYTVREFTVEESKEILQNRPQQLSLQEIYHVAQTYPQGSEAFNQAFQVAVVLFPKDATANLNAAAMEIQKGGDMALAKKYLAKADPKAAATLNNLGVVALLEKDYDAAQAFCTRAKEAGSIEAEANLKEIDKQRSYPAE